jgi:hypothetical protein
MVRAVFRAALFGGVLLAIWTLARPASAAAPLCDDRGATAIASPPPLQAPDEAIQRAHASATCSRDDLPLGTSVAPAHRGAPPLAPSADPGVPPAVVRLAPLAGQSRLTIERTVPPCDGVRYRVERPPRA